jgi:hypothetical protein
VPPLSCRLSACRHLLLGRPVPATDICVPHGRLTDDWSVHRTVTGFPCSAPSRCDRCRAPPIPRGRGALVADILTRPPLPPPSGGPCPSVLLPPSEVLHNEAYRGSRDSPFPVFPLPVTDGWNTSPWASSWASHPAVTSDACQERGRALSTRPELTVDHDRPSISVNSLKQCDLMSHQDPEVPARVPEIVRLTGPRTPVLRRLLPRVQLHSQFSGGGCGCCVTLRRPGHGPVLQRISRVVVLVAGSRSGACHERRSGCGRFQ